MPRIDGLGELYWGQDTQYPFVLDEKDHLKEVNFTIIADEPQIPGDEHGHYSIEEGWISFPDYPNIENKCHSGFTLPLEVREILERLYCQFCNPPFSLLYDYEAEKRRLTIKVEFLPGPNKIMYPCAKSPNDYIEILAQLFNGWYEPPKKEEVV